MFTQAAKSFQKIQTKICSQLSETTQQEFIEDKWSYDRGTGGGITKILTGDIIEKGGVNFSNIEGRLNSGIAEKLNISLKNGGEFKACGLSLVLHPFNPFVPTVHLNIRCFDFQNSCWFGGGIDLTPYYPIDEDIIYFHSSLKKICDAFDLNYYSQFKEACDKYFYLPHRKETRGVGGIFFDKLTKENSFDFTESVGSSFAEIYLPILKKRFQHSFKNKNRVFQAYRRSRYVEFNLLYDRGTSFGLVSGGRVDSIFMSLPPEVKWFYRLPDNLISDESELQSYLKAQNWLK